MEYGLIGKTLKHSFSKEIHESFNNYKYELKELNPDELESFMIKKDFKGINVTIPYKEKVIKYLDFIDDSANLIGAVNTIVNKNGKLYGYNTDYYGLKDLISKRYDNLNNKNILILGNGGTSKTTRILVKDLGASNIYIASRQKTSETITYDEIKNYKIDIIINTTPVGMYPNVNDSPLNLNILKDVEAVFDVIYNPINSKLLIDSKKAGVYSNGGLFMLVSQALYSYKYFTGNSISDDEKINIYNKILNLKQNIVLIGMPGSGKSVIADKLSKILNKALVDTDSVIIKENGPIKNIFETYGEYHFRELETKIICDYSLKNNSIISTGGGVIKNHKNLDLLKMNGIIFFIDRDLNLILPTDDRPLSNNINDLKKLYNDRYEIYKNNCDHIIKNNGTIDSAVNSILRILNYENISN